MTLSEAQQFIIQLSQQLQDGRGPNDGRLITVKMDPALWDTIQILSMKYRGVLDDQYRLVEKPAEKKPAELSTFMNDSLEGMDHSINKLEDTIAKLESRLATLEHLEQRSADTMRELAKEAVNELDLDSYVGTYLEDKGYVTHRQLDALDDRVEELENEGTFQNNAELALVNILEASYSTPDNFANFHRKFHALLKYHFGKLAREVKP